MGLFSCGLFPALKELDLIEFRVQEFSCLSWADPKELDLVELNVFSYLSCAEPKELDLEEVTPDAETDDVDLGLLVAPQGSHSTSVKGIPETDAIDLGLIVPMQESFSENGTQEAHLIKQHLHTGANCKGTALLL